VAARLADEDAHRAMGFVVDGSPPVDLVALTGQGSVTAARPVERVFGVAVVCELEQPALAAAFADRRRPEVERPVRRLDRDDPVHFAGVNVPVTGTMRR